jgi:hypothetical protein
MGCRRVPLSLILLAIALLATAALAASCGGTSSSAGQATSPAAPASTSPASTTPLAAEDAQAVRDLALAYWAAYNAYDPEKAISYLDESYRPAQEKIVRDDIGRIKTFGVKLGVSEKSAPVLIGPDQAEMYLNMKTPTGTRTLWMKFALRGDAWTITYVEEVK